MTSKSSIQKCLKTKLCREPMVEQGEKKIKISSHLLSSIPEHECPFNFTSPDNFFSSFISSLCSSDEFFNLYWEKQPCHKKAQNKVEDKGVGRQQGYFKKLFNFQVLEEIMDMHDLHHEADLLMCSYQNGVRTNLKKEGKINFKAVQRNFKDKKMTLQLHQPQRFHDELWKLQEILECYFGCLVGSNIYMTPECSQGLAPHYDNVEVFILQLEGSKVWKLYNPIKPLPKECSFDLTESDMNNVELIDEITLNAGDMLYFPRGTIHEARVLQGVGHSTHLTISAYESSSWQDYLETSLPFLADQVNSSALGLRRGLPINYFRKEMRRKHKEKLDEAIKALGGVFHEFMDADIADQLTCDFFANRLPPFNLKEVPIGCMPSLKGSVRFTHPHHVLLSKEKGLYEEDQEEDSDEDDDGIDDAESKNAEVFVYHSLANERSAHMLGHPRSKPVGLKFDCSCWNALKKLEESKGNFVAVKDLNLPDLIGVDMLVGLWSVGLIEAKNS